MIPDGQQYDCIGRCHAWKRGFTFEEIAVMMNIPVNTVKSIYGRAIKKLQKIVKRKNMNNFFSFSDLAEEMIRRAKENVLLIENWPEFCPECETMIVDGRCCNPTCNQNDRS
jgi:hypothetical protein